MQMAGRCNGKNGTERKLVKKKRDRL